MAVKNLVSIVIPVYNAEQYLDRCIQSVINQTYKYIEVILINDGSRDNSQLICEKYVKRDNRVQLINIQNRGPSAARNIGINISKGQFIQFIDSDDYLESNMIKVLVEEIKNNAQWVICGYRSIHDNNYIIDRKPSIGYFDNIAFKNEFAVLYEKLFFQYLWNKIYLSDIIKSNNISFNEEVKRGEDIIFNIEYLNYVNNITVIDKILYNYVRLNEQSLTRSYNKELFNDQKRIFKKILNSKNIVNKQNKNLIMMIYTQKIIYCISNIFMSKNNLCIKEKREIIKEILADNQVKENLLFIRKINEQGLICFCIKFKLTNIIVFYYHIKQKIKKLIMNKG